jgi:hypothetical protein
MNDYIKKLEATIENLQDKLAVAEAKSEIQWVHIEGLHKETVAVLDGRVFGWYYKDYSAGNYRCGIEDGHSVTYVAECELKAKETVINVFYSRIKTLDAYINALNQGSSMKYRVVR